MKLVWKTFLIELYIHYICIYTIRFCKKMGIFFKVSSCLIHLLVVCLAMRHSDDATLRRNGNDAPVWFIHFWVHPLSTAHRLLSEKKGMVKGIKASENLKAKENMLVSPSFMQSHTNKYFVLKRGICSPSSSIFLCEVVLMMFVQNEDGMKA